MLRNGDFLLLLALIWAAALSGPDPGTRCRAPGQRDPPLHSLATGPPLAPVHAEHGHVPGILLPSIPRNLEPR